MEMSRRRGLLIGPRPAWTEPEASNLRIVRILLLILLAVLLLPYVVTPLYRAGHPVSTGIVVQALARPEWVVEVDVFAVIPDSRLKSLPEPDEDLQWKDTADKRAPKSKAKRKKK